MKPLKLLVFAHVPPPFHGQSFMVKQLIDGLKRSGNGRQVEVHHVDARYSDNNSDIGRFGIRKALRLVRYVLQAVWIRMRYGVGTVLYVPASPTLSAVVRDWAVVAVLRCFFRRLIFHWHAVGLGEWSRCEAHPVVGGLTRRVLSGADLSIVLGDYVRSDAEVFAPRQVAVIPNYLPDPCSAEACGVIARRAKRYSAWRKRYDSRKNQSSGSNADAPRADKLWITVLFISLCTESKGLFDTMRAVDLANQGLRRDGHNLGVRLKVAGMFPSVAERVRFDEATKAMNEADEQFPVVSYLGFLDADGKAAAWSDADCLCFPTYYPAESFGLVVIEALAWGVPVLATRWRSLPEILPAEYPLFVEPRNPESIVSKLIALCEFTELEALRERFLRSYRAEVATTRINNAIVKVAGMG